MFLTQCPEIGYTKTKHLKIIEIGTYHFLSVRTRNMMLFHRQKENVREGKSCVRTSVRSFHLHRKNRRM